MAAKAPVHAYPKLGDARGRKRLWLEGRKLEKFGIEPGHRYTIVWDRETRTVLLDFASGVGDRKVSGRSRNGRDMPIIDIAAAELEETLGEGISRAKVTIKAGRIVVEVHPDDEAAQERLDRLMAKLSSGEPLLTGSLAHGGGILDHALHTGLADAGVHAKLAFAVEIDDRVLDAAARNNPIWDDQTLQIQGGMEEIEVGLLPQIDILVAGLPCTGASKAGKAKNHNATTEEHPRAGALFISFLNVIKHTKPAIVVLENVVDYGLSTSAKLIKVTMETWGYQMHETTLSGNDFGTLESRKRLCLIGISPEIDLRLDALVPTRNKEATLAEVLEDIGPESDLWMPYKRMIDKAARDKAKGSNFKINLVSPEATTVGALGAGYSKIRATEAKLRHPTDPDLIRQLTPREHAGIKTVPHELVEGLTWTMAHSILGNSVSWAAWRAVGKHLAQRGLEHAGVMPDLVVDSVSMSELANVVAELDAQEEEADLQMSMRM